jgi:hypothetical protein
VTVSHGRRRKGEQHYEWHEGKRDTAPRAAQCLMESVRMNAHESVSSAKILRLLAKENRAVTLRRRFSS